jgi:hypothetical protein
MTESQQKSKKDIAISKAVEQYADTKDPFVNSIYKKLRNKKKKLDKISENMIKSKSGLLEEMKELDGII